MLERSERLVAGNRLLCIIVASEGLVYQEHHQAIDNTAGDRNLRAVKNRHPKIRHSSQTLPEYILSTKAKPA